MKIEKATVYFECLDMDTGESYSKYEAVRTIYRQHSINVVRDGGRMHEAWHCPTDKVWKCHVYVRRIPKPLTFEQAFGNLRKKG